MKRKLLFAALAAMGLHLQAQPGNDLICNAATIQVEDQIIANTSGSTTTGELSLPLCGATGATNGIWYRLVAPPAGQTIYLVSRSGLTHYPTYYHVYTSSDGTCNGNLTCVAGNTVPIQGLGGPDVIWTSSVVPGGVYYILANNVSPTNGGSIHFAPYMSQYLSQFSVTPTAATSVQAGANNQMLLSMTLNAQGSINQIGVFSFTVDLKLGNGTTSLSDVSAVRIYRTTTSSFTNPVLYGTVNNPSSSQFFVQGFHRLQHNTPAYFWLEVDMAPTNACAGGTAPRTLDVAVRSFNGQYTPTNGDPAGVYPIIPSAGGGGSPVAVSASQSAAACAGATMAINISATGGTAPYTATVSPCSANCSFTFTGSGTSPAQFPAGTYNVDVTDANGCSASTSVSLATNNVLSASASSTGNVVINTGTSGPSTAQLSPFTTLNGSASGGDGNYSYAWTPSASLSSPNAASTTASPTATTTYTLSVTDGIGCQASSAVTVQVLDLNNRSQWQPYQVGNNVNRIYVCVNGITTVVNLNAACASTSSLCWALQQPGMTLGPCTAKMPEPQTEQALRIHPSPAQDHAWISMHLAQGAKADVRIIDVMGRAVWEAKGIEASAGEAQARVPVAAWPAGTYWVQVSTPDGTTLHGKLQVVR